MVRQLVFISMFAGACVFLVGCGHKSGVDGVVQVGGSVTYDGKPIEGASVIFSAEGESRSASGITDAGGRFQLTTLTPNDGALPGKYKVAVSKVEVENAMSAEEAKEWFQKNGGPPPAGNIKNRLPEKYKDIESSELTAEVTTDGKNDFTFDLK
ncbi:MAG TPA: carboxypeptidase-like regulatory domain-containing protein [Pirellulales bacterium]|nr:carboxypeptidase-like regulatory domain-containing protein [Pirellulales bacterium]